MKTLQLEKNSYLQNLSNQKDIYVNSAHHQAVDILGEGLQIDNGEIDFMKFGKLMNTDFKKATFIPEIWQGHKNGGEGFWIALKKLEKYFK